MLQFLTGLKRERRAQLFPPRPLPAQGCSLQCLSQVWSTILPPAHELMEALLPRFTTQAEPRTFLLCCTTQLLPLPSQVLLEPPLSAELELKVLFQPLNTALSQLHHTGLLLGFTYSQHCLFLATVLMFLEKAVTSLPGFYNHCFSLLSVLTCRSRPLYTEAVRADLIKFLCLIPD